MNNDDIRKIQESIRKIIDDSYINRISETLANIPRVVIPKFPKIDYSSLFPSNTQELVKQLSTLAKKQIDSLSSTLKSIDFSNLYPPNWKNGDDTLTFPSNLDDIVGDGIPLAYTPPFHVLEKIFVATSTSQRRKILSDNHISIAKHCDDTLKSIQQKELKQYVVFAKESLRVFDNGDWRASQALSTSILDSFLYRHFPQTDRRKMVDQGNPIDWKKFPTYMAFTIGAISANYGKYYPENGDKIPKKYSRHASAHGLSTRQYSKLNSLIVLMTVVSLLKSVEIGFFKQSNR